ncbi:PheA Prephenate dehydratase [Lipomyces orientalis]|uniref:PheA Prephenate dehydratase n=1 Tax=Lipomyces orientalis TaxID=1233043 RepID=A0ACC3TU20_9ASCO
MTNSKLIAYLGPPGTYSQRAVTQYFGKTPSGHYEYVPLNTIADCFTAVQDGTAAYVVVPFSNSSNGPVKFTYDLLRTTEPRPSIIGETQVKVEHYILAAPATLQRIEQGGEDAVRTVYSHPQVWGQCTQYLTSHFSNAARISVDSTAYAATLAEKDENAVAIASIAAADVFHVEVYAAEVQDNQDNYTRFLVLERYVNGAERTELDQSVDMELVRWDRVTAA